MNFYPERDPALVDITQAGSMRVSFSPDQLIASNDISFAEVFIAPAVAYQRGALLAFDEVTNTAQPAAAASDVVMICPFTITAEQASAQQGLHMQVYCEGTFNEDALLLAGAPLSDADLVTVKGRFNAGGNIRLRKMT
ncbi:hypothetical protein [Paraburkholderia tuberum]|uniref:Bacteriophage lambda head decoration protein D n=1 Tax=Paraburkholderia tuberum TaxID=157910 RepID=A0A1H1JS83_9BURK|nr:hypothetical protein [Paraburkholderia tuberum]SDR52881.1 hypothetical protein SAMN05445850_5564 [Paraburkholderia tuberum]